VLDARVPGRQAQGVGGDFQLALEVMAVACSAARASKSASGSA
jgi:hypothetical protein